MDSSGTRFTNPVAPSSAAASMARASSTVVKPVQIAPVKPLTGPSWRMNQLKSPMPSSLTSGPTIELRSVRFFASTSSPSAFERS